MSTLGLVALVVAFVFTLILLAFALLPPLEFSLAVGFLPADATPRDA
ncbi:hypothetical protein PF006_g6421 [Phytophthora fragariae]|uniref:Uncharacterized protein n=1 Tax=Phytophthora fragariae TaxID=53985 RepID=A0A6A3UCI5_9STRA|nr:hypothetical protein PF006_g6421 [Phytophthora fragariae]